MRTRTLPIIRTLVAAAAATCAIFTNPDPAAAQTSTGSISLQAKLEGVVAGPVNLTVQFYDAATGGNAVGAPIVLNGVPVQNGIVSVPVSPVDAAVFNGQTRYMGIRVNGGAELVPRTLVTSVPYAVRARTANLADVADDLVGVRAELVWPGQTPYLDLSTTPGRDYDYRVSVQSPSDPRLIFSSDIAPEALVLRRNGYVGIGVAIPFEALDVDGNAFVRGTTKTHILQITGADLAEPFNIAATDDLEPQPGHVLSIDPENPGKLTLADQPYDKKVAGAISGANGLSVGVVMGKDNADPLIAGDHPVAMSGRIYVWCDADVGGPIEAGDRLTTSVTPGHAMRASDEAKAPGAVIGKAMQELKEGRGMVLVLVNLQ